MVESKRPIWSRVGIMMLNFIGVGLGLIRLGQWRRGAGLWAASLGLWAATLVIVDASAEPSFRQFFATAAVYLTALLTLLIIAMVATWRSSAVIATSRPWWSRWYGLAAAVMVAAAISFALPDAQTYYRSFYVVADAMSPTLQVDDHIQVDMRRDRNPQRGSLVMIGAAAGDRLVRVVALAGDRIAMRGGVPVVNGEAARYADAGTMLVEAGGPRLARRLRETLPGETGSHEVLDIAVTPQDETVEVIVPPGRMFVLGDNRDNSADSRFPVNTGGLDMVPLTVIRGRPLFIYRSRNWSRIGTSLQPPG